MGEQERTIRFGLRLPESLYSKLQEQAREHQRSLNSEIVTALSRGLLDGQQLDVIEQIDKLREEMKKIRAGRRLDILSWMENVSRVAEQRGKTLGQHLEEVVTEQAEKARSRQSSGDWKQFNPIERRRRALNLRDKKETE